MFETLRMGLGKDAGNHTLNPLLRQSYDTQRENTCRRLVDGLGSMLPVDRHAEVGWIVDKAQALAMDLGGQRARLELFVPLEGEAVRSADGSMEICGGKTANGAAASVVQLAVVPALRKWGDIRGTFNSDRCVYLTPAKVYVEDFIA